MIQPTVGRIVHFYTKDASRQFNGVGEGPYAAVIAQVHNDRCASLTVFPPFAAPYSAGSVMIDDVSGWQHFVWPPRV